MWKHDCDKCKMLETNNNVDMYYCPNMLQDIVLRFSSEPADYSSLPIRIISDKDIADQVNPLFKRALSLAISAGFIQE